MNKIYGLKSDYAPVKREGTQIIVSYGYEAINKNEGTWYEVSLPAAKYPLLCFADAGEMHTICTLTSQHVLACQQDGWARKDAIDWEPYKALFPESEQPSNV